MITDMINIGSFYWVRTNDKEYAIAKVEKIESNKVFISIDDKNKCVDSVSIIAPVPVPVSPKGTYLYHATLVKNICSIKKNGLKPFLKQTNEEKGTGLSTDSQDKKIEDTVLENELNDVNNNDKTRLCFLARQKGDILLGEKDEFIYCSTKSDNILDYLSQLCKMNYTPNTLCILRWKNDNSCKYYEDLQSDGDYKTKSIILPKDLSYFVISDEGFSFLGNNYDISKFKYINIV